MRRGPVEEENVGGGTPMIGYDLKGSIGSSSRVCSPATVGVLVQLNCGRREDLTIDGVPVGRELKTPKPRLRSNGGSIIMVVATDLDLESQQLWKVAKRANLGLARTSSFGGASSGDFTIAFTTGKVSKKESTDAFPEAASVRLGEGEILNPIFKATVEATEEAIANALFKAETMVGVNGNICYEPPIEEVRAIFAKYGRNIG